MDVDAIVAKADGESSKDCRWRFREEKAPTLFMWRLERANQANHLYCVSNTARGGKYID